MAEAEATAHLVASLLKRLQRCGDITAECCAVACELLGAPLQLLDVRALRPGAEAPLAFFRRSSLTSPLLSSRRRFSPLDAASLALVCTPVLVHLLRSSLLAASLLS